MKTAILPPNAAKPIAPYTPAIAAGGFIFLSGQIALDPRTGDLRMTSIAEETEQVMENVRVLLKEAGLGFEDLVKVTIFLSSMDHYAAVNAVYARYFDAVPPAREAVAVKGLPRNVNVEISGIAVSGKKN